MLVLIVVDLASSYESAIMVTPILSEAAYALKYYMHLSTKFR